MADGAQTSGARLRLLAWGGAALLLAGAGGAVDASALAVGVTVPGVGGVQVTAPSVTVPSAPVPSVTVPSLTTPSLPPQPVPTPSVPLPLPAPTDPLPAPTVPAPSVPVPSVPEPSAPSVPGVSDTSSSRTSASGAQSAPAPSGGGGGADAAPSSAGGSDGMRAAAGLAHDRRRATFGTDRLVGAGGTTGRQQRLERTVLQLHQCLDDLRASERRVLALRAGIGPGAPLTRPQVARRLDLGLGRTGRIERRALRRLDALASAGACGRRSSTAASGWPASEIAGGAAGDVDPRGGLRPRFGVGGVVAHGGDEHSGGRSGFGALPPPLGDGGEATLLVALGLLVALALLVRRELLRR